MNPTREVLVTIAASSPAEAKTVVHPSELECLNPSWMPSFRAPTLPAHPRVPAMIERGRASSVPLASRFRGGLKTHGEDAWARFGMAFASLTQGQQI